MFIFQSVGQQNQQNTYASALPLSFQNGLSMFSGNSSMVNYGLLLPYYGGLENNRAEILKVIPFIGSFDKFKQFLSLETRKFLQNVYNYYNSGSETDAAALKFQINSMGLFTKMRFSFADADSFIGFNKAISSGMNEKEKAGLISFWLNDILRYYDHDRAGNVLRTLSQDYDAKSAIDNYLGAVSGKKLLSGICGDINGSIANLLAESLGFKHSALVTFTPREGHVISFLKGSEGYWAVDYGRVAYLGGSPTKALDMIAGIEGKMTPFASRSSMPTAFLDSETTKVLSSLLDMTEEKLLSGTIGSLSSDGIFGARTRLELGKFSIGVFALNSIPAFTFGAGIYGNYSGDKGRDAGAIFIPNFSAGLMLANTNSDVSRAYPIMLSQIVPFVYRQQLGWGTGLKLNPITVDFATDFGGFSPSFTSSAGLVKTFDIAGKEGKFYADAHFRFVRDPRNFYYLPSTKVATNFDAGFVSGSSKVEVGFTPQSMANKFDLKISQGFGADIFGKTNFLVTLDAKFFDDKQFFGGATLGFTVMPFSGK